MTYHSGRRLLCVICIALLVVWGISFSEYRALGSAHVIVRADRIITMDPQRTLATHLAMKDERILAVGSASDIELHRRWFTREVEYSDATIMPGLVEAHTHPVLAAVFHNWLDVSGISYPRSEQVYAALKRGIAERSKGEWVFAFGLDPVLTKDLELPDRDLLDELAPDNPVFIISQVIHTAWVNSAVLAAAGIDDSVQDPPGGHFERDANGRLTGVVHEEAMKMLLVPTETGALATLKQALGVLIDFSDQYLRYSQQGVTSIGVLGPAPMFEGYLSMLEWVGSSRRSPLRTYVMPLEGEIEKTDYSPGYQNGRYRVIGVKLHMDGSPWTGGMATMDPYLVNDFTRNILGLPAGHRGILKHTPDEFRQLIAEYHAAGWQLAVHAHGERAQTLVLDAYEAALTEVPRSDHRHRIEHVGLLRESDMNRMQILGVSPSFFIDHIYYFGPTLRDDLLGAERASRFMALKSATDRLERVTLHMDSPATPIDPWRMLRTATTRVPRDESIALNGAQAMSVMDALEAVTIDAAWQLHADAEIGSLEVSKYADLVVLSENPLSLAPSQWHRIKTRAVWVGGQVIQH